MAGAARALEDDVAEVVDPALLLGLALGAGDGWIFPLLVEGAEVVVDMLAGGTTKIIGWQLTLLYALYVLNKIVTRLKPLPMQSQMVKLAV